MALWLVGGCASHPPPAAPPLRGYVNLGELAHHHPGWNGISQYDTALRRMEQAVYPPPTTLRLDQALATLPALPNEASLTEARTSPEEAEQADRRLVAVQQSLMADLTERREMARADQVQQQQDQWRQEARDRFLVPAESGDNQPDLRLQLLRVNIEALTKTVENWKLSQPPTPKLNKLQAQVEAERAELAALTAELDREEVAAQLRRREAILAVRESRRSYVQGKTTALEDQLRADDERLIAAQSARLTRQRSALIAELARSSASALPSAGNVGQVTLPRGPGLVQASLSPASLKAAETRLETQRARWIQFLYEDTQAAAQDVADQRRWTVTFGPKRPSDQDLTAAMIQAMSSGVWHL